MAPSTKCPTEILKYVCKLMKKSSPKYILIPKNGGCLMYVNVMDHQYEGKISQWLAEARATAASNALKKIIEANGDLKKDDLVQEYLARCEDHKPTQVCEPSEIYMNYVDALMSMEDVKDDVLSKAMMKKGTKAECEKFLAMSVEERSKWLETL